MNKIYNSIWNEITGTFVAVAETAKARGKRVSSHMASGLTSLFKLQPLALALMASGIAHAAPPVPTQLPTGGNVVAGQASISQTNAVMNINQTSNRAVLDWTSFNVGSSAAVNFVQPSANSATLNRVLDANPSQILGRINANGQVFLTNPSGIYFGKDATINVGALTATTHSIGNADFMAGNLGFSRNGATGSVVNDGSINAALGGYVALLAPEVRNNGIVVAQMGTVAMAAGEVFELQFDGARLSNVRVAPATIAALVENKQAVQAPGGLIILSAQAANRLQGGVVNNSGMLEANGLTDNGGTIRLSASDRISHTGSISANAAVQSAGQGGTVIVMADLANHDSVTEVNGSISARGGEQGGDGGFVETSAGRVKLGDATRIDTSAPQGRSGTWLIDPDGFTIAASGGDISGATLSTNLNSANVTIASTSGAGNDGNVNVNDHIWWNSHKLTITATNDVNVNAVMTMTGTSQLDVTTGSTGKLNMGFDTGGSFKGRIDLPNRSGTFLADGTSPILAINGSNYTVINSLGVAADATSGTDQTLQGMARSGNLAAKFVLGSDVDASGISNWTPVGTSTNKFSGIFNGLGHSVSNLAVNRASTDDVGLFGYVTSSDNTDRVSNIAVTHATVTGQNQVGALVGSLDNAKVSNAYATGTLSGAAKAGGLVGSLTTGALSGSHANVAVTASGDSAGGLLGFVDAGSVSNSYASGAVVGAGNYIGGLVGHGRNASTLNNVYATGSVTGTKAYFTMYVGGLMGYGQNVDVSNAYATGSVSTSGGWAAGLGGLIGGFYGNGSVRNAFATGHVAGDTGGGTTSGTGLGGLIGNDYTWGTVQNVFATGNISGAEVLTSGAGGLVGNLGNGTVQTGYATGTVNGTALGATLYRDLNVSGNNQSWVPPSYAGAIGVVTSQTSVSNITNIGYIQPTLTTNTLNTAGAWTTASNWSLGHAPTVLEKADLGNKAVSISQIVAAGDVTAAAGSQINFTAPLVSSLTIGQSGTVTLGAAASDVTINYGSSGKINLPAASTLSLNGTSYTVVNTLGASTDNATTGHNTLQGLAHSTMLGGTYVLGMDVDASDTATWNSNRGFAPIGSYNSGFTGSFNGLGHSVVNLTINRLPTNGTNAQIDPASYLGLFGYVNNGNLTNVGTVGAKVMGYYYVGGLVGKINLSSGPKTYANLWSVEAQAQGADNVGGEIGNASASGTGVLTIDGNHASGTVTGLSDIATSSGRLRAAGLIGYAALGSSAAPGTLSNSYSLADVLTNSGVTSTANGGLLGTAINTSLSNTYATGRVNGVDNIGGLVGYGLTVRGRYDFANGAVTGSGAAVGGLIGALTKGDVWYDRASGAVSGASKVGGLIGSLSGSWGASYLSLLVSDTATGNVSATGNDVGGAIGRVEGYATNATPPVISQQTVSGVSAFGSVSGNTTTSDHVGGLIGYAKYVNLDTGKVNGSAVTGHDQVGGLVGMNDFGDINRSKVTNAVVNGHDQVGGLVGANNNFILSAATVAGSITASSVVGTNSSGNTPTFTTTVTGNDYVGGLVGYDERGQLSTSNKVGTIDSAKPVPNVLVTGVNNVGGLAGRTNASTIANQELQVEVHGANYTGGAIGVDTGSTLTSFTTTNTKVVAVRDATSNEIYAVGGLLGKGTNSTINAAILSSGVVNAQDAAATAIRAVGGMVGDAAGVIIQEDSNGTGSSASTLLQVGASGTWGGTVDGIGGVVGKMAGGAISKTQTGGSLTVQGNATLTNIGGVVGQADTVTVFEVSSDRTISAVGASHVGGIAGKLASASTITDAYTQGSINAGSTGAAVGGIVGLMDSTGGNVTIDNAYSTTQISSPSSSAMGALVGTLAGGSSSALITDSFYNTSVNSGLTGVGGGVADSTTHIEGKTTAELQNISTFQAAGWDVIASGSTTNYPALGYRVFNAHKWVMAAPLTTTIYLRLIDGSSIYGDVPTLTYGLYSAATGGTQITNANPSGTVVWSTPLSATSNANTYGETYVSGITLGNTGYTLSVGSSANWVINPRPLNVSVTKVYDGNVNYSAGYVFTGMVNGNSAPTVSSGAASVSGKNVGNYTSFATNTLTLSDSNYTVVGGTVSADITAKALTVSGTTAASKTYDGNTTAALSGGALVGVVSGDTVTLTEAGTFANKNAGTGKAVTVFDTIRGADAGNYTLTQPTGLSADITAKALTVSGTTAASKTYDGNTTAALSGGALVGVVGSDAVTLSEAGTFANKNAGTGKAVTVFDTISGADAGNYTLTQPSSLSADITPKVVTVAGLVAQSKVFDATTAVVMTDWGMPSGMVGAETLALLHGSASLQDATAGVGKTVTVTGYSLADGMQGGLAANYQLATTSASTTTTIAAAAPAQPVTMATTLPVASQGVSVGGNTPVAGSASGATATSPVSTSPVTSKEPVAGQRFSGITVSLVREPSVQQAGVIAVSLPKEMATAGAGFTFALPEQVVDASKGNPSLRVTLSSGEALPSWLKFNPETQALTATAVPDGAFPVQLVVIDGAQRTTVVISEKAQ